MRSTQKEENIWAMSRGPGPLGVDMGKAPEQFRKNNFLAPIINSNLSYYFYNIKSIINKILNF